MCIDVVSTEVVSEQRYSIRGIRNAVEMLWDYACCKMPYGKSKFYIKWCHALLTLINPQRMRRGL